MRAITTDAIFTRFSSRVDGSISATLCTPELATPEKVALMELHGKNVKILIQPNDEAPEAMITVKGVLDFKSPSQRLRSVLYCDWKQKKPDMLFQEWYDREMDRIIEYRKSQLEPEQ